ncbi:MAG: tetratricopeptide repeat protein [Chloroflexota bacterium]
MGSFEARFDDSPVTLRRKTRGLVAYLAMSNSLHSRSSLCDLLFSESNDPLGALRWQLSQIRSKLGAEILIRQNDLVGLNRNAVWIDAVEYERRLMRAVNDVSYKHWQSVIELYRGEFLETLNMPDSSAFELWMLGQRAEIRLRHSQVLTNLINRLIEQERLADALVYAQRLVMLEPLQEGVYYNLIWLYGQTGQFEAAIQQYEKYRDIWQTEFGEEPSSTLQELMTELAIAPKPVAQADSQSITQSSRGLKGLGSINEQTNAILLTQVVSPDTALLSNRFNQPTKQATLYPQNLPNDPLPFVGRKQEINELRQLLASIADCRLLTLVGPGGMGKTRLAIETARTLLPGGLGNVASKSLQGTTQHSAPAINNKPNNTATFADGIIFVELDSVATKEGIPATIADAITATKGDAFHADIPLDAQLINYLGEQTLLLILDNCEHLLDGASILSDILAASPNITILATSRSALNIREEWFFPLEGLAYPAEDHVGYSQTSLSDSGQNLVTEMESYDAVRLFINSASRARADFDAKNELLHVIHICQLVEGMPLALELAAIWLRTLPIQKLVGEITKGLDLLTTRQQNMPRRHRSMRLLLEQSWQVLSTNEQKALSRLSIFRGGFCADAAETVTGTSFFTLAMLADSYLIRVSQSNIRTIASSQGSTTERYRIHELLRQFAHEQLLKEPQSQNATCTQHSRYYLDLLSQYSRALKGKEQASALAAIDEEIDNIYAAWQWAVDHRHLDDLSNSAESFYKYQHLSGRYHQGVSTFEAALAVLSGYEQALSESTIELTESSKEAGTPVESIGQITLIRCRWLAWLGVFYHYTNDFVKSHASLEESLTLAQKFGHQREIAFALNVLGWTTGFQGNEEGNIGRLSQSLAISRTLHDHDAVADTLIRLSNFYSHLDRFVQSKEMALESVTIAQSIERADLIIAASNAVGLACYRLGETEEAERYRRQALAIAEEVGHQVGIMHASGGLGFVGIRGDQRKAQAMLPYAEQGLAISRRLGIQLDISGQCNIIGQLHEKLGNYEEAIAYGEEGLQAAQKADSPFFICFNYNLMASVACKRNDFESAKAHVVQSLEAAINSGTTRLLRAGVAQSHSVLFAEADFIAEPSRQAELYAFALSLLHCHIVSHTEGIDLSPFLRERVSTLEEWLPPSVAHSATERGYDWSLLDAVHQAIQHFSS